jgi:hypothetical protein
MMPPGLNSPASGEMSKGEIGKQRMSQSKPTVRLSVLHLIARSIAKHYNRREASDIAELAIIGWPRQLLFYDSDWDEYLEVAFEFQEVAKRFVDYYYQDYELWQRASCGRLIKRAICVDGQIKFA